MGSDVAGAPAEIALLMMDCCKDTETSACHPRSKTHDDISPAASFFILGEYTTCKLCESQLETLPMRKPIKSKVICSKTTVNALASEKKACQ